MCRRRELGFHAIWRNISKKGLKFDRSLWKEGVWTWIEKQKRSTRASPTDWPSSPPLTTCRTTRHSNYGGSSEHGGAFPHRGLRWRAAPRAHSRRACVAHRVLRRRGTCHLRVSNLHASRLRLAESEPRHVRRTRCQRRGDCFGRHRGWRITSTLCTARRRRGRVAEAGPETCRTRASPARVPRA